MLKQNWKVVSWVERCCDNAIIIAAFLLTYALRDHFLTIAKHFGLTAFQELRTLGAIQDYLVVLVMGLILFNSVLSLLGGYRSMRLSSVWEIAKMSLMASALVFLCQGSLLFILKLDLSRSFVGLFSAVTGVMLLVERILVLIMLRYFRIRGKNYRNILIAGTGAQARKLFIEITRQPILGLRVVGFVDLSGELGEGMRLRMDDALQKMKGSARDAQSAVYDLSARIVASPHTFESALKRFAVDEVLFTDVISYFPIVEELAGVAVEEGVTVTMAADLFSLEIFQSDISYFNSIPLIHYEASPADTSALAVKRVIDLVVSSALIVALSPFALALAVVIKTESPGPVFFRQKRVGLNGRTFTMYKFRSMVDGAERMLSKYREFNEMEGPVFKIKNDPRVTRIGKFLRRYSIDELPQLFNVLRGDMSLVGPRPPLPEEVSLYVRKQRRRLSMRPGLTCTWQVSGRNEIPDFEKWAQLDLDYIDNWSLKQDFKLLAKTIPAVLTGSGAR